MLNKHVIDEVTPELTEALDALSNNNAAIPATLPQNAATTIPTYSSKKWTKRPHHTAERFNMCEKSLALRL